MYGRSQRGPRRTLTIGSEGNRKGETVPDLAGAFYEIRQALKNDLLVATPAQWEARIPTRPQWTVRDTLAMLAGFAHSLIEGRWTEDYSDSWADHDILDGLHATLDGL